MKFHTPNAWLKEPLKIHLVGAGGNGSHMLDGLVTLNFALKKLGHAGLHVTVYDGDEVSEANIARSQFYSHDVGHNKAILLVNRINNFHNLDWDAVPTNFSHTTRFYLKNSNLVISCVDSVKSRREIHDVLAYLHRNGDKDNYWLDMGNAENYGQVIFGQFRPPKEREPSDSLRLKTVTDLYPDMLDESKDPVDVDTPSCSVMESLHKQGLFINKLVATNALYLLSSIFTEGGLDSHHGMFINAKSGITSPLRIDPDAWRRMAGKPPVKNKKQLAA
ncbi:MAG: PRTRC system ThiF family protein [Methylophilus sp.]|uniref:PRTRC system ThiF family protein n=1 Tax=Methylophilus sp. TaxID=29541 RepID=UPI003FA11CCC